MILLYGVTSISDKFSDSSNSNYILKIPLDLKECRRFKDIAFLKDIILNYRFDDSTGRVEEVTFTDNRIEKAIIFDKKNLIRLLDEYSSHRQLRQSAGELFNFEPERATYEFLQLCFARNLEVISFSKIFLQEYE